jgi:hypothetical protein
MISIALIHSNIESRTPVAQAQLRKLCGQISASGFEVFAQGGLEDFGDYRPLYWGSSRRRLIRRIYKGRVRPSPPLALTFRAIAKTACGFVQNFPKNLLAKKQKESSTQISGLIERYLFLKHLNCHQRFLESNSSVLVVLEDDATLSGEAEKLLEELALCLEDDTIPTFLELTCSFPPEVLGVEYVRLSTSDLVFNCVPASSNTTAAYACNRKFSEAFLEFLAANPLAFNLPVDAALDYFFHERRLHGLGVVCLHRSEPLFSHGSLRGLYPSAIR